jgi:hypothetical protein
LISGSSLVEGAYYVITDFQTIYDRPDYNADGAPKSVIDTVTASPELIMVLATSSYSLDSKAYSLDFPDHQIKYDVTFNQTEYNNSPAKGRITERIDSTGNRADYDTEGVTFKRYTYYFSNNVAYTGTIDFFGTINVTGAGTLFTSELVVGDVFIAGGYSFKVDTIIDDFTMTVVSNNQLYSSLGDSFYGASYYDFTKKEDYRDNNTNDYQTIKTFGANCYNNYIGDNTASKAGIFPPNWLLSNNTIRAFSIGNTLGLSCINNHLAENSVYNSLDDGSSGNIQTNGNFEYNILGKFFSNNILKAFNSNKIGVNCLANIFGDSSQNNVIGDDFFNNIIDTNFAFNTIDYSCSNNNIGNDFIANKIGVYFSGNSVGTNFSSNEIGNGFSGNTIGNFVQNNVIRDGFATNIIGNAVVNNVIGNDFVSNTTGINFIANNIGKGCNGNTFGNNVIRNNIGSDFSGNVIGDGFSVNFINNAFDFNTIGTGCNNNQISGGFRNSTVGDDFINNVCNAFLDANIIGNDFQSNIINTEIIGVDFTLATHVYNTYTCELIERVDGTKRLKYMDNTDAIVVDDIDN